MRAFVLTAPGVGTVQDVPEPVAAPGEALVDVARAGVCGTDVEFFTGEMAYLADGHASYPMRLGHEWTGTVRTVADRAHEAWVGRRVIGDTMLGDGTCRRCRRGQQHVCDAREEVGIRGGRAGALAERVAVPVSSLHALPDAVDATLGALVEPGANALRAAQAAVRAGGDRVLVIGPGTIGLLTAMFARAAGAEVHLLGVESQSLQFARTLDVARTCGTRAELPPDLPFDAVVDATNSPDIPALALQLVEPAGRVVYIGLAATATPIDTRALVLGDITAVGILSGSPALEGVIAAYADGSVDPRALVSATVGLDAVADVLAGARADGGGGDGRGAGAGPKVHVDPGR